MRTSSLILRSAVVAVAVGCIAPLATLAQTFAATTGTDPVLMGAPASSLKVPVPKNAEDKLLYGRVRDGVYTVDGMVAKVQLNYDINGARYVYLFVPGLGTALLSSAADPDAVVSQAALKDGELSFTTGEHHFKLTGIALANNKGKQPEHLYVKLDRAAWQLNRRPMVGYGNMAQLPYQWPGALAVSPAQPAAEESEVVVPPVPASLLPSPRAVKPSGTAAAPVSPAALRPVSMP